MPNDPTAPHRASLRQALLRALPGDSDLDAFCLDFYASVHQRFSQGMDRQAKLNLLLQYASTEDVAAKLARFAPEVLSLGPTPISARESGAVRLPAIPGSPETRTWARSARWGWGVGLIGLPVLVLGLGQIVDSHWNRRSPADSPKTASFGALTETPRSETIPGQPVPIVTSPPFTHAATPLARSPADRLMPSSKAVQRALIRRPVHITKKEPAHVQPMSPKYVLPPLEE
jgi:hypothetical protein